MAPVESYIQRNEQKAESWFIVKPGQERETKKFPQAALMVKCDATDLKGTFKVKTEAPDYIGAFLFENDLDQDPRPLEPNQEHHFTGTQRVEIYSSYHDEVISLRHNVAAGVVVDSKDALEAETVLAHAKALLAPKMLPAGAAVNS